MSTKESGMEDDPNFKEDACRHHDHKPPGHLVVLPGKRYRHVCPGCGEESIITPPNITL